jgi:hypothetical protein
LVNDGIEKKKKTWEKEPWVDPTGTAWVEPSEGTDVEKAEKYEAWLSERAKGMRDEAIKAREAGKGETIRWLSSLSVTDMFLFSFIVLTIEQRLSQPTQPYSSVAMVPARTPLRFKRVKRCATCSTILIRPEPKAANPKFRLRNVARLV